jgi:hypothetical protein
VLYYATQKAIPFPVMDDGLGDVTAKFGAIDSTPTTYIYNKEGKRLQYTVGKLDFIKLNQLLSKELT